MVRRLQQNFNAAKCFAGRRKSEMDVPFANARYAHLIIIFDNQLPAPTVRTYDARMHALSIALALVAAVSGSDADALFTAGDFTAAKAAYTKALAAGPKDAAANLGLARLNLYENRLEDAASFARATLAVDSRNAAAQRVLQTVEQREGVLASAQALNVPQSGIVVPFLEVDPLPLMQFTVDGRAGNFLLDTGGPDVVLDPGFATELGLKITNGQTGIFAGGRTAQVRQAIVPDFRVGPLSLHGLRAGILPSRELPFFKGRKIDGVIGTVFLSRFLATIDYPHRRLILHPRSAAPPAGTAARMWLVGDHFMFAHGSVNGLPNQLFLVDSGLAGGGFGPEERTIAAAHVKTFPGKAQMGMGGGGAVKFIPVVADTLCLSTACQNNISGMYTPGGSPLGLFPFAAAGTVSHTYLKHYAVTLDFSAMKIILTQ